nr:isoform 2 of ras suppressor protein 1 [Quercus suber]
MNNHVGVGSYCDADAGCVVPPQRCVEAEHQYDIREICLVRDSYGRAYGHDEPSMALPSSPPPMPEVYPPSSPILLPIDFPSAFSRPLKRQFSGYESQQSSDPVFSDTPSDAEQQLEEQGDPKRKKIVRGPWWNVQRSSDCGVRRSLSRRKKIRNFDSGVWMGSDSSEESVASVISDQQRMQTGDVLANDDTIPNTEAIAVDFIQRCLDQGKETVDLTDLGLFHISNATLRPLHQLIRHSHDKLTHPPSEDEFVSLTPSLQLFLANNHLVSLPTELFTFTNLTVLSLRSNELNRLPAAIGRLQNLHELNVSGNQLKFLPWEMLKLFSCGNKHREITVRPNPLVEPVEFTGLSSRTFPDMNGTSVPDVHILTTSDQKAPQVPSQSYLDGDMCQEMNFRLQQARREHSHKILTPLESSRSSMPRVCREELIYLASSRLRYFAMDGTPVRRIPESQDEFSAVHNPTCDAPQALPVNRVPSLYELSLRIMQTKYDLQDTRALHEDMSIAPNIVDNIKTAARNVMELGNDDCSSCQREMILPRAIWVEYWFHGPLSEDTLTRDKIIPFLRKACSWACATPTKVGTLH